MELTGIILAGGMSSRMGQDKGLMQFRGKQMVQYSIDLLSQFTSHILISSNNPLYNQFNLPVIADIYKNCGPIGGLHASLLATTTKWNIILSCDAPYVDPKLFQSMLKMIADQDAIVPKREKGFEPLFGIYNRKLSPFLEEKIKMLDYKLQKILKERDITLFDTTDLQTLIPNLFSNINSPEDLKI